MSIKFARAVRAFVVCETLTVKQLQLKADLPEITTRQFINELIQEGLVLCIKTAGVRNNPYIYKWIGGRDDA